MKIALLLHGLTRRYDISYPFIKEFIIDKFNADVFISCWDNQVKEENIGKGDNLDLQKMIDLYNPIAYDQEIYNDEIEKKFVSEKFLKIFHNPKTHYKNNWSRLFAFYYKIWKCNELKKEYEIKYKFKYDVVIKWRPDVFTQNVFTDELLNQVKNNNSLYIPYGHGGDINDLIYISNTEIMDKISQLYFNLETVADYVAPIPSFEKHLKVWLDINNININYFNIDWNYIAFRPDFKIKTLNKNFILNKNI